jgi:hypothetical protein
VKKINDERGLFTIYPNVSKLRKLIVNRFNNKAAFAREIGVNRTTISKIITRERAGAKFFGGLIKYCERENLDYKEYIVLQSD